MTTSNTHPKFIQFLQISLIPHLYIPALYIKTAGHYINDGNPFTHKIIFQLFILYMKNNIWTYDSTVATIEDGKGKILVKSESIML